MTLDEIKEAYEQARAYGKRTSCHVLGTIAIKRVLDAGVNVISHGFYPTDELAEQMAAQNVYYDPTLSSYGRQTVDPKLKRGEEWIRMHMNLIPPMEEAALAALRAGAGRYAEDVEIMPSLALPAKENLLACTRYAAGALAIDGQVGTVEPGKIADLVVLGADPMADPYAIEDVVLVLQSGKPLKPHEIVVEPEVAY